MKEIKYKNVAIWVCTPKSDVESEEKMSVFELRRKTKMGKKPILFFREKTLVAKMATKAETLVAKRKI